MPTADLPFEMGLQKGEHGPFQVSPGGRGGGGQAGGALGPPAQPLTMTTASHHLKSIKSMENGGATAGG